MSVSLPSLPDLAQAPGVLIYDIESDPDARDDFLHGFLRLGRDGAGDTLSDMAHILVDQARIVDGEPLPDPAAFSRRLAALLERGLI